MNTGEHNKTTQIAEPEFVIARMFDAPRELVWRVWTEGDHLAQWFGPKGVTIISAKNDLPHPPAVQRGVFSGLARVTNRM